MTRDDPRSDVERFLDRAVDVLTVVGGVGLLAVFVWLVLVAPR